MPKNDKKGNIVSKAVKRLFSKKNETTMPVNAQKTEKQIEQELYALYEKHFDVILTGNKAHLNKLATNIASYSSTMAESRFASNLATIVHIINKNQFFKKNNEVNIGNPDLPQAFKKIYSDKNNIKEESNITHKK